MSTLFLSLPPRNFPGTRLRTRRSPHSGVLLLTSAVCLTLTTPLHAQTTPPVKAPSVDAMQTSPVKAALPTVDLSDPAKKEIAMQLVSSAENSTLDWRAQYAYIEDIDDGRGYTAGIIGFCSGTSDLRQVVRHYTAIKPDNLLAKYLPALDQVNGSASHAGLDPTFTTDWKAAAPDPAFRTAQDWVRDKVYFAPAIAQGKADGLRTLGQFLYYDALVMHGPGDGTGFAGIRQEALRKAKPPAQGGDEAAYLNAFLDARIAAMRTEAAHENTSRVDTAQRLFVQQGNFDLSLPLAWKVYGKRYEITEPSSAPVSAEENKTP